jgi:hypothetical protein
MSGQGHQPANAMAILKYYWIAYYMGEAIMPVASPLYILLYYL